MGLSSRAKRGILVLASTAVAAAERPVTTDPKLLGRKPHRRGFLRAFGRAEPDQHNPARPSAPGPRTAAPQWPATLAAPDFRISFRIDLRRRRRPARDPALDPGVDRQLSFALVSLASHFRLHRLLSRPLQRPGITRYLDRLRRSPPLPRTQLTPERNSAGRCQGQPDLRT